jgi:hypothetical protein
MEKNMKKHYASILLTLVCVVGFGVGAHGQEKPEVIVTVPFEFVANGKALPAGTYTISRIWDDRLGAMSISSRENRSGVLVRANDFEEQPDENSKVIFEQVGDLHLLSKIQTLDGVYSMSVPHSSTLVAGVKQHQGMSPSGTN